MRQRAKNKKNVYEKLKRVKIEREREIERGEE